MINCRETIPFSLLIPTLKTDKLFKWPILSGIFPSKLLKATEKFTSNERFPKEGGIPPVSVFLATIRAKSLVIEPSSIGIFPISLFDAKAITLSSEQLVKLVGISPPSVLFER